MSDGNVLPYRSTVFIALGSNLDNPLLHVQRALRDIDELPETNLARVSSMYETAPVGFADQPPFVNAVAQITTALSPHDVLARLHAIEARHGRRRNNASEQRNGPRTLDLDILLFDDMQINERGLAVPHPRMHERAFVLVPLVEIAAGAIVPGKGAAKELLAALDDTGVSHLKYDQH
jgi:2-amino-4-hydroxy-6-hydroxymethyldihydropteridine diphosphokinase